MRYLFENTLTTKLDPKNSVWTEIAKAGKWSGYEVTNPETGKSETITVEITSEMLDEMIRNFEDEEVTNHKLTDIHVSHPGSVDYQPGAVGWITKLKRKGDSLYALLCFLGDFATDIRNGKWAGFSIEARNSAKHPKSGEPIGTCLTGLGVTNRPFIRGMEFPGLSQNVLSVEPTIYLSQDNGENNQMSEQTEVKNAEETPAEKPAEEKPASPIVDALRAILSLPELTEEEVSSMLKAANPEAVKAALVPAEAKEAEVEAQAAPAVPASIAASQLVSELTSMSLEAQVSNLSLSLSQATQKISELSGIVEKHESAALTKLIDSHIAEGKIVAGQRDGFMRLAKLDRALFDEMIKGAPKMAMGQLVNTKAEDTLSAESTEAKAASEYATKLIEAGRKNKTVK